MIPWRLFRLIWIAVTNGFVLYLSVPVLIDDLRSEHGVDMWFFGSIVTVVLMIAGIILEALRMRAAQYINVGYHLLSGAWIALLAGAAYLQLFGVSPEVGMGFFIYGIPSLIVASVNVFLYRSKIANS